MKGEQRLTRQEAKKMKISSDVTEIKHYEGKELQMHVGVDFIEVKTLHSSDIIAAHPTDIKFETMVQNQSKTELQA